MSSGEITELCKWTVVRIDGAYFVLGKLAYLASCETGLGLLAAVPKLCHEPHRPGILYGYVDSCYETYHIAPRRGKWRADLCLPGDYRIRIRLGT